MTESSEAAPATPIVEVEALTKHYDDVAALRDVDLGIHSGEFLTLLGPSGCGKTTLLRCIAGLEIATSGRVRIAGKDVTRTPPERRPANMVFQRYALFPHLNVVNNVMFGLQLRKIPKGERRERAVEALRLVRLTGYERRMPSQLSGGQAQRVALARALVNEPKVLLLDEPLAALDRKIRQHMQQELRDLQRRTRTTFLYVTHDQEEAMAMSDRIVLMRDGRIEQIDDPPGLYHQPRSSFAAGFVGDANIVTGEVCQRDDGRLMVEWHGRELATAPSDAAKPGAMVQVLLRPEALELCDEAAVGRGGLSIEGDIVDTAYYGFYSIHRVAVGDEQLIVRDHGQVVRPRGHCRVMVDARRVVVLG